MCPGQAVVFVNCSSPPAPNSSGWQFVVVAGVHRASDRSYDQQSHGSIFESYKGTVMARPVGLPWGYVCSPLTADPAALLRVANAACIAAGWEPHPWGALLLDAITLPSSSNPAVIYVDSLRCGGEGPDFSLESCAFTFNVTGDSDCPSGLLAVDCWPRPTNSSAWTFTLGPLTAANTLDHHRGSALVAIANISASGYVCGDGLAESAANCMCAGIVGRRPPPWGASLLPPIPLNVAPWALSSRAFVYNLSCPPTALPSAASSIVDTASACTYSFDILGYPGCTSIAAVNCAPPPPTATISLSGTEAERLQAVFVSLPASEGGTGTLCWPLAGNATITATALCNLAGVRPAPWGAVASSMDLSSTNPAFYSGVQCNSSSPGSFATGCAFANFDISGLASCAPVGITCFPGPANASWAYGVLPLSNHRTLPVFFAIVTPPSLSGGGASPGFICDDGSFDDFAATVLCQSAGQTPPPWGALVFHSSTSLAMARQDLGVDFPIWMARVSNCTEGDRLASNCDFEVIGDGQLQAMCPSMNVVTVACDPPSNTRAPANTNYSACSDVGTCVDCLAATSPLCEWCGGSGVQYCAGQGACSTGIAYASCDAAAEAQQALVERTRPGWLDNATGDARLITTANQAAMWLPTDLSTGRMLLQPKGVVITATEEGLLLFTDGMTGARLARVNASIGVLAIPDLPSVMVAVNARFVTIVNVTYLAGGGLPSGAVDTTNVTLAAGACGVRSARYSPVSGVVLLDACLGLINASGSIVFPFGASPPSSLRSVLSVAASLAPMYTLSTLRGINGFAISAPCEPLRVVDAATWEVIAAWPAPESCNASAEDTGIVGFDADTGSAIAALGAVLLCGSRWVVTRQVAQGVAQAYFASLPFSLSHLTNVSQFGLHSASDAAAVIHTPPWGLRVMTDPGVYQQVDGCTASYDGNATTQDWFAATAPVAMCQGVVLFASGATARVTGAVHPTTLPTPWTLRNAVCVASAGTAPAHFLAFGSAQSAIVMAAAISMSLEGDITSFIVEGVANASSCIVASVDFTAVVGSCNSSTPLRTELPAKLGVARRLAPTGSVALAMSNAGTVLRLGRSVVSTCVVDPAGNNVTGVSLIVDSAAVPVSVQFFGGVPWLYSTSLASSSVSGGRPSAPSSSVGFAVPIAEPSEGGVRVFLTVGCRGAADTGNYMYCYKAPESATYKLAVYNSSTSDQITGSGFQRLVKLNFTAEVPFETGLGCSVALNFTRWPNSTHVADRLATLLTSVAANVSASGTTQGNWTFVAAYTCTPPHASNGGATSTGYMTLINASGSNFTLYAKECTSACDESVYNTSKQTWRADDVVSVQWEPCDPSGGEGDLSSVRWTKGFTLHPTEPLDVNLQLVRQGEVLGSSSSQWRSLDGVCQPTCEFTNTTCRGLASLLLGTAGCYLSYGEKPDSSDYIFWSWPAACPENETVVRDAWDFAQGNNFSVDLVCIDGDDRVALVPTGYPDSPPLAVASWDSCSPTTRLRARCTPCHFFISAGVIATPFQILALNAVKNVILLVLFSTVLSLGRVRRVLSRIQSAVLIMLFPRYRFFQFHTDMKKHIELSVAPESIESMEALDKEVMLIVRAENDRVFQEFKTFYFDHIAQKGTRHVDKTDPLTCKKLRLLYTAFRHDTSSQMFFVVRDEGGSGGSARRLRDGNEESPSQRLLRGPEGAALHPPGESQDDPNAGSPLGSIQTPTPALLRADGRVSPDRDRVEVEQRGAHVEFHDEPAKVVGPGSGTSTSSSSDDDDAEEGEEESEERGSSPGDGGRSQSVSPQHDDTPSSPMLSTSRNAADVAAADGRTASERSFMSSTESLKSHRIMPRDAAGTHRSATVAASDTHSSRNLFSTQRLLSSSIFEESVDRPARRLERATRNLLRLGKFKVVEVPNVSTRVLSPPRPTVLLQLSYCIFTLILYIYAAVTTTAAQLNVREQYAVVYFRYLNSVSSVSVIIDSLLFVYFNNDVYGATYKRQALNYLRLILPAFCFNFRGALRGGRTALVPVDSHLRHALERGSFAAPPAVQPRHAKAVEMATPGKATSTAGVLMLYTALLLVLPALLTHILIGVVVFFPIAAVFLLTMFLFLFAFSQLQRRLPRTGGIALVSYAMFRSGLVLLLSALLETLYNTQTLFWTWALTRDDPRSFATAWKYSISEAFTAPSWKCAVYIFVHGFLHDQVQLVYNL